MQPGVLIAKLQWFGWSREAGRDRTAESFGVGHDGLEIFHADNDMHVFLHMEVFKICRMDLHGRLERLLQYLYFVRQYKLRLCEQALDSPLPS